MTPTAQAIVTATLVCGTLDAIAASTQAAALHIPIARVWKGVASGLLGPRALESGSTTVPLGLALHYFISLVISISSGHGRGCPSSGSFAVASSPIFEPYFSKGDE